MNIFDVLTLIGGLCLFLFGMNLMGDALERSAGSRLEAMIGKLTTGKLAGLLTGLGVTAVVQSSSATTVMVVGFVNSKLMTLKQAIHVIMGANIGTTVTAWILSLSGISGSNMFLKLLKPSSFTPILALIGIIFIMFAKSTRKKDIAVVLLGFATLMFGMETMTDAVSGLKVIPAFRDMFILFTNPILGVVVGVVLTAIIQSSSPSVHYRKRELLESGLVKPEDTARFVGNIHKEAARLVSLINDIIRLSQLDEDQAPATETVDLYEAAREVADDLSSFAEKNVTLSVEGDTCKIFGVRRYVYEIIYNLCDNAIRYNVDGGRVDVTVGKDNSRSYVEVKDTGIGIPHEHQSRIFERFYRVDKSHSKATGGTGLGLSIVKHAVQYHSGKVTLESEAGKGTKITVIF